MKKKFSLLGCALTVTLTSSPVFAEELFVCVALGVNIFSRESDTANGFGQSEAQARAAALHACRLRGNANCQIAHCGRTTPEMPEAAISEEY